MWPFLRLDRRIRKWIPLKPALNFHKFSVFRNREFWLAETKNHGRSEIHPEQSSQCEHLFRIQKIVRILTFHDYIDRNVSKDRIRFSLLGDHMFGLDSDSLFSQYRHVYIIYPKKLRTFLPPFTLVHAHNKYSKNRISVVLIRIIVPSLCMTVAYCVEVFAAMAASVASS